MKIVSIFGQLDAAAAEVMIERGKATRIEPASFPPDAPRFNKGGTPVRFAIILPTPAEEVVFEEMVEDFYA